MSRIRKVALWVYGLAVTVAGYLYFGIASLGYSVAGPIAHAVSGSRANRLAGRRTVSAGFRSFLWLWRASGLVACDLSALDRLRGEPGLMIAPNHPSLLDAVVVISRLPEVACIMKASLLGSPFIGGGARWSGHITNDSGSAMIRQAAQELREGGQLLVFPEGTRTKPGSDKVNPFKGGFALIAREAQSPVQTVILRQTSGILGKGWPWWKLPEYPIRFHAELGRRFAPPPIDADVRAWMTEIETYFRGVL
jgi:1-acyl-sn-glycerol-3-phosphate acyltransferase